MTDQEGKALIITVSKLLENDEDSTLLLTPSKDAETAELTIDIQIVRDDGTSESVNIGEADNSEFQNPLTPRKQTDAK